MDDVAERAVARPLGVPAPTVLARMLRFVAVGGSCYLVQLGLLDLLQSTAGLYLADVAAFLLSAQMNFALSQRYTWGDRQAAERITVRWMKFNVNAMLSVTVVNGATLWVLVHLGLRMWVAMLLANAATAVSTFVVNHHFVFSGRAVAARDPERAPA